MSHINYGNKIEKPREKTRNPEKNESEAVLAQKFIMYLDDGH